MAADGGQTARANRHSEQLLLLQMVVHKKREWINKFGGGGNAVQDCHLSAAKNEQFHTAILSKS